MFQLGGKNVLVAASLFFSLCAASTTHGGLLLPPKALDGDYATVQFTTSQGQIPVKFNLSNGLLTNPGSLAQYDFAAADLSVTAGGKTPLSLGTTDFTLISTAFPGTIDFTIVPSTPLLAEPNEITSQLTLNSTKTSTNLKPLMVNLGSALLTLTFPSDVNLDPSWGNDIEPVTFTITQLPEPASILHLVWLVLLGIIHFWRLRYRTGTIAI